MAVTSLSFAEEFEYKYFNYLLMIALILIFIYQKLYGLTFRDIGYNYKKVLRGHEYWRCYTSTVTHTGVIHLVMNVFTLWGVGSLNLVLGTLSYIKFTLLIFLINDFIVYPLARYLLNRFWPHKFPDETLTNTYSLGYSGVLFGLIGLTAFVAFRVPIDWECQRCDQWTIVFGSFPVDSTVANGLIFLFVGIGEIVLSHFIFSNVDTVGHVTGFFVGCFLGFGSFIWFNSWCLLILFVFLLIVFIVSVWRFSHFSFKTHCFKKLQQRSEPNENENEEQEQTETEKENEAPAPKEREMESAKASKEIINNSTNPSDSVTINNNNQVSTVIHGSDSTFDTLDNNNKTNSKSKTNWFGGLFSNKSAGAYSDLNNSNGAVYQPPSFNPNNLNDASPFDPSASI